MAPECSAGEPGLGQRALDFPGGAAPMRQRTCRVGGAEGPLLQSGLDSWVLPLRSRLGSRVPCGPGARGPASLVLDCHLFRGHSSLASAESRAGGLTDAFRFLISGEKGIK